MYQQLSKRTKPTTDHNPSKAYRCTIELTDVPTSEVVAEIEVTGQLSYCRKLAANHAYPDTAVRLILNGVVDSEF